MTRASLDLPSSPRVCAHRGDVSLLLYLDPRRLCCSARTPRSSTRVCARARGIDYVVGDSFNGARVAAPIISIRARRMMVPIQFNYAQRAHLLSRRALWAIEMLRVFRKSRVDRLGSFLRVQRLYGFRICLTKCLMNFDGFFYYHFEVFFVSSDRWREMGLLLCL